MAKKKGKVLTCQGYEVALGNSPTAFAFQLTNVQGSDGKEYSLKIMDPDDNLELIKAILKAINDRLPGWDWKFQIDDDGNITDVG